MRHLLLAPLLAAALSAPAAAQNCFGPDQLSGPCWGVVNLDLPPLGPFALPGSGLCWDACIPVQQDPIEVRFSAPVEVECGHFRSDVEVIDLSFGVPVLFGTATLDYTRTWDEVEPITLARKQVWRFVAKVDLALGPVGVTACWVPSCLTVHSGAFHYGYVDYVEDCATGQFEHVAVLNHPCDFFIHFPGLSDRPGAFHPDQSTALVAPDTLANPFVPTPSLPPTGALIAEAMRDVRPFVAPGGCVAEDPIAGGSLDLLGAACLCPLGFTSNSQSASRFTGTGTCLDLSGLPSSFSSLNFFNLGLPFAELARTSLGTWTTGASYPGPEAVFAAEGLFLHRDSCVSSLGLPPDTLDMFYGASTDGGYPVTTVDSTGLLIGEEFTDVASNYSRDFSNISLPIFGSVGPSDHLIYVNTQ